MSAQNVTAQNLQAGNAVFQNAQVINDATEGTEIVNWRTMAAFGFAGSGTVTSVGTGTGLTGGPITGSGVINLEDTAVTPGTYNFATLTVDQQGRLTSVSTGVPPAGTVTTINTGVGLTGGPITGSGTISLATTSVTPGSYTLANITVDAQGRITSASSGVAGSGTVSSITAGDGLDVGAGPGGTITTSGVLNLEDIPTITPGNYTLPNLTVDQKGRITFIANNLGGGGGGSGTVSVVSPGTGLTTDAPLSGADITTFGTLSLTDTGVVAGSYTRASITVDPQGRITSINSNMDDAGVEEVTAGTGLNVGAGPGGTITGFGTLNLSNTGVVAGSYTRASLTVDPQGRITTISSNTDDAGVEEVTAGTGLNVGAGPGGVITGTGTLNLSNTGVSAGTYGTYGTPEITVDAQGRITNASNNGGAPFFAAYRAISDLWSIDLSQPFFAIYHKLLPLAPALSMESSNYGGGLIVQADGGWDLNIGSADSVQNVLFRPPTPPGSFTRFTVEITFQITFAPVLHDGVIGDLFGRITRFSAINNSFPPPALVYEDEKNWDFAINYQSDGEFAKPNWTLTVIDDVPISATAVGTKWWAIRFLGDGGAGFYVRMRSSLEVSTFLSVKVLRVY